MVMAGTEEDAVGLNDAVAVRWVDGAEYQARKIQGMPMVGVVDGWWWWITCLTLY